MNGAGVLFADLSAVGQTADVPEGWEVVGGQVLFDSDAFRRDFIHFLESCPYRKVFKGECFDELFRRPDGNSLWWTSIGASRTPGSEFVRNMQHVWSLDRLLAAREVDRVVFETDCRLVHVIRLKCAVAGIPVECLDRESDSERGQPSRTKWFLWHLLRQFLVPLPILFASLAVRFACRGHREHDGGSAGSSVVFRPHLSRLVDLKDRQISMPFWAAFLRQLNEIQSNVRPRFLLRPKHGKRGRLGVFHWMNESGTEILRQLDGAVPPAERYSGLRNWIGAMPRQLLLLWRYWRIEGQAEFGAMMMFAETNVTTLVIPRLRHAIAEIAEWERVVGQLVCVFSRIPDLKAAFALAEFYPVSMGYIEAAQRLKIPVIGVQHGTIYPDHYIYTVPKSQIENAPCPDYFACYGEYDRDVVCELGSYPRSRAWVTGAPRLDHLVKQRPSRSPARERLGLPAQAKIILIATHTPRMYPWFSEVVRAVFDLVKDHDEWLVCVKPHPGDMKSVDRYQSMAEELGASNVRFFPDRFDELLAACDILISGSSTTVMEATLLGRPTICANFSHEPERYPYVQDGASLPARTPSQLAESLELALSEEFVRDNEKRREAFLRRHLGPTADGEGAKTLVQFLLPLFGGSQESSGNL